MSEEKKKIGLTGFITALAGLVGAIGALILALNQIGWIGQDEKTKTVTTEESSILVTTNESSERVKELERKMAELDAKERALKEKEVQAKLDELEKKLKEKERTRTEVYEGKKYNLSGDWTDVQSGSLYRIQQIGNDIIFTEYVLFLGIESVTTEGSGEIDKDKIQVDYTTIFSTNGKLNLEIKNDGALLKGKASDLSTGATIFLNLTKLQ